tara:strand:+ start:2156 stop:3772 length:1617 start_codon:yes stop_codon:yes gene_type:complete
MYRYYTQDETTDETDANVYKSAEFKARYGSPRRISLEFDEASMLSDNTRANLLVPLLDEIFTPENLSKITSELMLQSSGYTKVTAEILNMQTYVKNASGGSAASNIDTFFKGASSPANKALFESLIQGITVPSSVYINTSTGRPTIESADNISENAMEAFIATDFVYDVIEASAFNPFSIHGENLYKNFQTLKALQTTQRRLVSPLTVDLDEYKVLVDPIEFNNPTPNGIDVLGYLIFKQDISSSSLPINKPTILITSRSQTEVYDYNVKYGVTYRYSLHPICLVKSDEESILIIGTKAKTAEISAVENVPPPPVEAIQFDWTGSVLNLRWGMPMSQINDNGGPIGDIKAYQIFSRSSTNKPFNLKRMLLFYDGNTPYKHIERTAGLVTNYDYPVHDYTCDITPDIDYIFAICVIDAHGNSSNLSPQYKVRLNSYTNMLDIDFISFKGAPKQYPNFMMAEKIFLDSIKISNSKNMTVFYNPDETAINIKQSTVETTNYKAPHPDSDSGLPDSPSYRLQIINTNSQSGEILDIFLPDSE